MTDTAVADFDRRHLWHPYARMPQAAPAWEIESADGVFLRLADGRRLIDGMSSWWAALHGYNHPRLNAALRAQAARLPHVMFGGLTHAPAVELGRRLLAILPAGLEHLFFCDSGSVAVEVALKMAQQYWFSRGRPARRRLATIRRGYHGDTLGAMSVSDPENGMHRMFQGLLPQQLFARAPACGDGCDHAAADDLDALLARHQDEVAAVILEPVVQGAGGMRVYSAEYLRRARAACDRHDILLIFDEIATGFGRSGTLFACEQAGVAPDIMCVGKSLGAGYLSIAATAAQPRIAAALAAGPAPALMHGPTYMANPLACAVACANLDLLATGAWREQVHNIEAQLREELAPCRALDAVAEVRVKGAIGVVETRAPVDTDALCRAFVEQGVWLRPFGHLVYTMPPYITAPDELAALGQAIRHTLRAL